MFIHNLWAVQCVHRCPAAATVSNAVGRQSLIESALAAAYDLGSHADQSQHEAGTLHSAFGITTNCGDPINAGAAVASGAVVGMDCVGGGDLGQNGKGDAVFGSAELGDDLFVVLGVRHWDRPSDPMVVTVPAGDAGVGVVAQVEGDRLKSIAAQFA